MRPVLQWRVKYLHIVLYYLLASICLAWIEIIQIINYRYQINDTVYVDENDGIMHLFDAFKIFVC